MDQHSIGEKSELGQSLKMEPGGAFHIPRFALPRLRHFNRVEEEQQGSDGSGDMAPSPQQIDRQGNSLEALGTPLPHNLIELDAENNVGSDVFRHVPLADIIVRDRLRGVVEASVSIMMDSVSESGVIHPPVVRPDPAEAGKYALVSGLQRINAAKVLGNQELLCRVVALDDHGAALWEVDENLARASLSPADEALFIARRREVYELLHGKDSSKAKGAAAANAKMGRRHAAAMLAPASFSEDTANRTGKSQRSIQRAIQRATQNGSATLTRVARTALDTGAELDALPLLPRAIQEELIEEAAAGAQVSAVQARREMRASSATKGLDETKLSSTPDSTETESYFQGLSALKEAWLGASSSAREAFLEWIEASR